MLNVSSKPAEPPAAPQNEMVAPAKRWPGILGTILQTAVLFIVGQGVGVLLIAALVALTGGSEGEETTLFGSGILLQFAYAVAAYGLMMVLLLWLLKRKHLSLSDLGLTKRLQLSDAGWAVVVFAAYMAAYVILLTFVRPLVPGLDVEQKQDVGFEGASGLWLVLVFVALAVIAPVAEELLMRGFLFTALRRKIRYWFAALVTSLIFASLHLAGGEAGAGLLWIAAVDTFILSLFLCYLREKTGRLWASIGVHMIKNTLAFTLLFIVGID